jgi:hypothetical protein
MHPRGITRVAFEITTTNKTASMNTDNVSQTEESNLNSTRLFPSNPTGVLTSLLQTQNFDNNIRSLLNILINSMNNADASARERSISPETLTLLNCLPQVTLLSMVIKAAMHLGGMIRTMEMCWRHWT